MSRQALSVKNVSVNIGGHPVLEDISCEAEEGDLVYILGGNGSGKTTLIKTILGLIPVKSGSVEIFGEARTQESISEYVGYQPQYSTLDRQFPISVNEIISLECDLKGGCELDLQEHLELFQIKHLLRRKLSYLSGGEFQKVLIARALVTNPQILILDEPSNNLDVQAQKILFEEIKRLNRDQSKTIFIVTHDHNLIKDPDAKVFYLSHGKLHSDSAEHVIKKHTFI